MAEKTSTRQDAARRTPLTSSHVGSRLWVLLAAAWLVPGAGHLWLGRRQKGVTFLLTLPIMFAIGLSLNGRLFPFHPPEPLVALAALATVGMGLLNMLARLSGMGAGDVTAVTWEYGNAFMIVAGLLNMLVVLDAFDIAEGRK